MKPDSIPTAEDLETHPILASIAVTEHILEILEAHMLAAHPDLRNGAANSSISCRAERLLELAAILGRELRRYRGAILLEQTALDEHDV